MEALPAIGERASAYRGLHIHQRGIFREPSCWTSTPRLDTWTCPSRCPTCGSGRYWEVCDPRGEEEFKRHLDEWDRQLREVHAGPREHLKSWNQLTYDLGAMTRDEHGRLRLDCRLGTYYHSLSTSECLDAELRLTRPGLEVEPMWWDRLRASTIVARGAAAVELGLQVARAVVS